MLKNRDLDYVKGQVYPHIMSEYHMQCEMKLHKILRTMYDFYGSTSYFTGLNISWEQTRFDFTGEPLKKEYDEFEDLERRLEFSFYDRLYHKIEKQQLNYVYKINLTYEVVFRWLRRPSSYTDYYSVHFMDMLSQEGINFTPGDIKWLSDESNGQMFDERFEIDFSKEVPEEIANEIMAEWKQINKEEE